MDFELGSGSREDFIRLGREMDSSVEQALALTEQVLSIKNRLGRIVSLVPNDAQQRYARASWRQQKNIVLKARQMGVTTWIAGQFFLHTVTHPGTVTVLAAHTQEAAEAIFRIVHRFLRHLPDPLRGGALKTAKASARRLLIPALDSEFLVETAGDRNAGRGLTITNLHCTELARWPGDAAETLYGLMATLSPAGVLAMESTPAGATGCFWNQWQSAERTGTARHFFPWWLERAYAVQPVVGDGFNDEEMQRMEKDGLSPTQIGYRRRIRENFRGLARQEYAEDPDACFLASGSCYFEVATIDRRLQEVTPPFAQRPRGNLRLWLPPQPGRSYLVAVDPAGGGTAGDYTAMQVIDLESGMQCAEAQDHLAPAETATEAAKLAREYNHALLAVERNSLGHSVLTCLGAGSEPYANVYVHDDGKEGFLTTSGNRDSILSDLYAALEDDPRGFMSERLLRECRCFVRTENGRVEAKAGEHDDLVLAMAMALRVRKSVLGRVQVPGRIAPSAAAA